MIKLVQTALVVLLLAPPAFAQEANAPAAEALAGDVTKGEKVAKKCLACHTFEADAKPKTGPTLWGILDRPTASTEGYNFSPALKALGAEGHIWSAVELDTFLTNPRKMVPGSKMAFAGLKSPQDRADLVAYLATLTAP